MQIALNHRENVAPSDIEVIVRCACYIREHIERPNQKPSTREILWTIQAMNEEGLEVRSALESVYGPFYLSVALEVELPNNRTLHNFQEKDPVDTIEALRLTASFVIPRKEPEVTILMDARTRQGGYHSPENNVIALNPQMPVQEKLLTVDHEAGHGLFSRDLGALTPTDEFFWLYIWLEDERLEHGLRELFPFTGLGRITPEDIGFARAAVSQDLPYFRQMTPQDIFKYFLSTYAKGLYQDESGNFTQQPIAELSARLRYVFAVDIAALALRHLETARAIYQCLPSDLDQKATPSMVEEEEILWAQYQALVLMQSIREDYMLLYRLAGQRPGRERSLSSREQRRRIAEATQELQKEGVRPPAPSVERALPALITSQEPLPGSRWSIVAAVGRFVEIQYLKLRFWLGQKMKMILQVILVIVLVGALVLGVGWLMEHSADLGTTLEDLFFRITEWFKDFWNHITTGGPTVPESQRTPQIARDGRRILPGLLEFFFTLILNIGLNLGLWVIIGIISFFILRNFPGIRSSSGFRVVVRILAVGIIFNLIWNLYSDPFVSLFLMIGVGLILIYLLRRIPFLMRFFRRSLLFDVLIRTNIWLLRIFPFLSRLGERFGLEMSLDDDSLREELPARAHEERLESGAVVLTPRKPRPQVRLLSSQEKAARNPQMALISNQQRSQLQGLIQDFFRYQMVVERMYGATGRLDVLRLVRTGDIQHSFYRSSGTEEQLPKEIVLSLLSKRSRFITTRTNIILDEFFTFLFERGFRITAYSRPGLYIEGISTLFDLKDILMHTHVFNGDIVMQDLASRKRQEDYILVTLEDLQEMIEAEYLCGACQAVARRQWSLPEAPVAQTARRQQHTWTQADGQEFNRQFQLAEELKNRLNMKYYGYTSVLQFIELSGRRTIELSAEAPISDEELREISSLTLLGRLILNDISCISDLRPLSSHNNLFSLALSYSQLRLNFVEKFRRGILRLRRTGRFTGRALQQLTPLLDVRNLEIVELYFQEQIGDEEIYSFLSRHPNRENMHINVQRRNRPFQQITFDTLPEMYKQSLSELSFEEQVRLAREFLRRHHLEDYRLDIEAPTQTFSLRLDWAAINNQALRELSGFSRLRELDLIHVTTISDLTALEGLNLTELTLWDNPISDFQPVSRLKNLQYLCINDIRITDFDFIKGLDSLETLIIHSPQGAPIISSDVLRPVAELAKLKGLHTNYPNILRLFNSAKWKTSLTSLSLGSVALSDLTFLKELTHMEELDLRYNPINDIRPLLDLHHLKRLNLVETPVTEQQVIEFLNEHIHGREIEVRLFNKTIKLEPLTFAEQVEIARAFLERKMQEASTDSPAHGFYLDVADESFSLGVHGIRLQNEDIRVLAPLTHLISLRLENVTIEEESSLGNLKNLTYLGFINTNLLELTPVLEIPQLIILDVPESNITDEQIYEFLQRHPNGQAMTVRNSRREVIDYRNIPDQYKPRPLQERAEETEVFLNLVNALRDPQKAFGLARQRLAGEGNLRDFVRILTALQSQSQLYPVKRNVIQEILNELKPAFQFPGMYVSADDRLRLEVGRSMSSSEHWIFNIEIKVGSDVYSVLLQSNVRGEQVDYFIYDKETGIFILRTSAGCEFETILPSEGRPSMVRIDEEGRRSVWGFSRNLEMNAFGILSVPLIFMLLILFLIFRRETNCFFRVSKGDRESLKHIFSPKKVYPEVGRKSNRGFKALRPNLYGKFEKINLDRSSIANRNRKRIARFPIDPQSYCLIYTEDGDGGAGIYVNVDDTFLFIALYFNRNNGAVKIFVGFIRKYEGLGGFLHASRVNMKDGSEIVGHWYGHAGCDGAGMFLFGLAFEFSDVIADEWFAVSDDYVSTWMMGDEPFEVGPNPIVIGKITEFLWRRFWGRMISHGRQYTIHSDKRQTSYAFVSAFVSSMSKPGIRTNRDLNKFFETILLNGSFHFFGNRGGKIFLAALTTDPGGYIREKIQFPFPPQIYCGRAPLDLSAAQRTIVIFMFSHFGLSPFSGIDPFGFLRNIDGDDTNPAIGQHGANDMNWSIVRITQNQTTRSSFVVRIILNDFSIDNSQFDIVNGYFLLASFLLSMQTDFVTIPENRFLYVFDIHNNVGAQQYLFSIFRWTSKKNNNADGYLQETFLSEEKFLSGINSHGEGGMLFWLGMMFFVAMTLAPKKIRIMKNLSALEGYVRRAENLKQKDDVEGALRLFDQALHGTSVVAGYLQLAQVKSQWGEGTRRAIDQGLEHVQQQIQELKARRRAMPEVPTSIENIQTLIKDSKELKPAQKEDLLSNPRRLELFQEITTTLMSEFERAQNEIKEKILQTAYLICRRGGAKRWVRCQQVLEYLKTEMGFEFVQQPPNIADYLLTIISKGSRYSIITRVKAILAMFHRELGISDLLMMRDEYKQQLATAAVYIAELEWGINDSEFLLFQIKRRFNPQGMPLPDQIFLIRQLSFLVQNRRIKGFREGEDFSFVQGEGSFELEKIVSWLNTNLPGLKGKELRIEKIRRAYALNEGKEKISLSTFFSYPSHLEELWAEQCPRIMISMRLDYNGVLSLFTKGNIANFGRKYKNNPVDVFVKWSRASQKYVITMTKIYPDDQPPMLIRFRTIWGQKNNEQTYRLIDSYYFDSPSHRGSIWARDYPKIKVCDIDILDDITVGRLSIFSEHYYVDKQYIGGQGDLSLSWSEVKKKYVLWGIALRPQGSAFYSETLPEEILYESINFKNYKCVYGREKSKGDYQLIDSFSDNPSDRVIVWAKDYPEIKICNVELSSFQGRASVLFQRLVRFGSQHAQWLATIYFRWIEELGEYRAIRAELYPPRGGPCEIFDFKLIVSDFSKEADGGFNLKDSLYQYKGNAWWQDLDQRIPEKDGYTIWVPMKRTLSSDGTMRWIGLEEEVYAFSETTETNQVYAVYSLTEGLMEDLKSGRRSYPDELWTGMWIGEDWKTRQWIAREELGQERYRAVLNAREERIFEEIKFWLEAHGEELGWGKGRLTFEDLLYLARGQILQGHQRREDILVGMKKGILRLMAAEFRRKGTVSISSPAEDRFEDDREIQISDERQKDNLARVRLPSEQDWKERLKAEFVGRLTVQQYLGLMLKLDSDVEEKLLHESEFEDISEEDVESHSLEALELLHEQEVHSYEELLEFLGYLRSLNPRDIVEEINRRERDVLGILGMDILLWLGMMVLVAMVIDGKKIHPQQFDSGDHSSRGRVVAVTHARWTAQDFYRHENDLNEEWQKAQESHREFVLMMDLMGPRFPFVGRNVHHWITQSLRSPRALSLLRSEFESGMTEIRNWFAQAERGEMPRLPEGESAFLPALFGWVREKKAAVCLREGSFLNWLDLNYAQARARRAYASALENGLALDRSRRFYLGGMDVSARTLGRLYRRTNPIYADLIQQEALQNKVVVALLGVEQEGIFESLQILRHRNIAVMKSSSSPSFLRGTFGQAVVALSTSGLVWGSRQDIFRRELVIETLTRLARRLGHQDTLEIVQVSLNIALRWNDEQMRSLELRIRDDRSTIRYLAQWFSEYGSVLEKDFLKSVRGAISIPPLIDERAPASPEQQPSQPRAPPEQLVLPGFQKPPEPQEQPLQDFSQQRNPPEQLALFSWNVPGIIFVILAGAFIFIRLGRWYVSLKSRRSQPIAGVFVVNDYMRQVKKIENTIGLIHVLENKGILVHREAKAGDGNIDDVWGMMPVSIFFSVIVFLLAPLAVYLLGISGRYLLFVGEHYIWSSLTGVGPYAQKIILTNDSESMPSDGMDIILRIAKILAAVLLLIIIFPLHYLFILLGGLKNYEAKMFPAKLMLTDLAKDFDRWLTEDLSKQIDHDYLIRLERCAFVLYRNPFSRLTVLLGKEGVEFYGRDGRLEWQRKFFRPHKAREFVEYILKFPVDQAVLIKEEKNYRVHYRVVADKPISAYEPFEIKQRLAEFFFQNKELYVGEQIKKEVRFEKQRDALFLHSLNFVFFVQGTLLGFWVLMGAGIGLWIGLMAQNFYQKMGVMRLLLGRGRPLTRRLIFAMSTAALAVLILGTIDPAFAVEIARTVAIPIFNSTGYLSWRLRWWEWWRFFHREMIPIFLKKKSDGLIAGGQLLLIYFKN